MTTQEILDIVILIEIVIAVIVTTAFIIKHKKSKIKIENKATQIVDENIINTQYRKKLYFLTPIEQIIFKNIQIAIEQSPLVVYPQINLATIIERTDNRTYHNELFRNLDYCLFKKNTYEVFCAIELNDKTHLRQDRQERDIKIRAMLNNAGIPLITLYTGQKNTPEYIKEQIANLTSINNTATN